MKIISVTSLAIALGLATASWNFMKPIVMQNGSAVIYAMTHDGKNGGKPATVKLPANMTPKQYELLNFAYEVAKTDGHKNPQYLQGIIMQESHAGQLKDYRVAGLTNRVGDRYFGVGQIKLVAAKAVMNRYPEMWRYLETRTDEELQARLILDDKFNVRVASKYALLMGINDNPTRAITAYNQGPGGVNNVDPQTHDYTVKVKQLTEKIKKKMAPKHKKENMAMVY